MRGNRTRAHVQYSPGHSKATPRPARFYQYSEVAGRIANGTPCRALAPPEWNAPWAGRDSRFSPDLVPADDSWVGLPEKGMIPCSPTGYPRDSPSILILPSAVNAQALTLYSIPHGSISNLAGFAAVAVS